MGRGCTMDEWVHFEKLPEEGRVPNSSYWYVHCRHCAHGFEQKQLVNPPAKLTGRRTSMRAHLKTCPIYATRYKIELAAAAAAAAAAKAQQQIPYTALASSAATGGVATEGDVASEEADGAAAVSAALAEDKTTGDAGASAQSAASVVDVEKKRKRKIDSGEVIGPRKQCRLFLLCV